MSAVMEEEEDNSCLSCGHAHNSHCFTCQAIEPYRSCHMDGCECTELLLGHPLDSIPWTVREARKKFLSEQGFGLIEATIAMFIAALVMTVIMSTMIASTNAMNRTLRTHELLNESESAAAVFAASAKEGEWDTVWIDSAAPHIIFVAGGACQEWRIQGTTLQRKEWTPPDAYPTAFIDVLHDVQSGQIGVTEDVFSLSLTARSDKSYSVTTERLVASLFAVPPVADPPVVRTNPCVA